MARHIASLTSYDAAVITETDPACGVLVPPARPGVSLDEPRVAEYVWSSLRRCQLTTVGVVTNSKPLYASKVQRLRGGCLCLVARVLCLRGFARRSTTPPVSCTSPGRIGMAMRSGDVILYRRGPRVNYDAAYCLEAEL